MDIKIENLAPDADVIHVVIGDNVDSQISVTIDRDMNNNVHVWIVDNASGSEHRMILGQEGFTEKL